MYCLKSTVFPSTWHQYDPFRAQIVMLHRELLNQRQQIILGLAFFIPGNTVFARGGNTIFVRGGKRYSPRAAIRYSPVAATELGTQPPDIIDRRKYWPNMV